VRAILCVAVRFRQWGLITINMTETVKTQNGQDTTLMIAPEAQSHLADLAGQLKGMTAGISISPRYYEFEAAGESIRCLFMGFSSFSKIDKETGSETLLNAVVWMDENQRLYLNAGTSLVSAFVQAKIDRGTPVEITYEGTKKVESGKMKLYDVKLLKPSE